MDGGLPAVNGREDGFALPILRALVSNTRLQKLSLRFPGGPFTAEMSQATQHLLESTTCIQHLELEGDFEADDFRPIAEGLIASTTVREVAVTHYIFRDRGSVRLFNSILNTKKNLASLSMRCDFPTETNVDAVNNALRRPNSSLRCLEIEHVSRIFSGPAFEDLVLSIQQSKLERLSFGVIFPQDFVVFANGIAAMPIRELAFATDYAFVAGFAPRDVYQRFFDALKRNLGLQSIKAESNFVCVKSSELFDHAEQKRVAFYMDRNERLGKWLDNPETVPQELWPEALKLTLDAGKNILYESLCTRCLAAKGLCRGRKRGADQQKEYRVKPLP